jgi:type I site-specific restriction-modification system R (restriction) subunit
MSTVGQTEKSIATAPCTTCCAKNRFLELSHDFIVFDAGIKKLCRHRQYFGARAAETPAYCRPQGYRP